MAPDTKSKSKGKSGEGSGKNAYWGAVQKHRDAGENEGTAREHGEQDMKASDFYMVESLARVNDDFNEIDDFQDDIEPPRYVIWPNKGKYEVWDMETETLVGKFSNMQAAEKHVEVLEKQ